MRNTILAGLAIPLIAAAPAWAQGQGQGQVSTQDRHFAEQAATAGQKEIAEARVAESRATDPAVREFARWMIADHSLLDEMLRKRAQQAQITLPAPAAEPQIQKTTPADRFDAGYVAAQVADHRHAVKLFETEARSGQDPQLRSFAQTALPLLQAHLAEAQDLQSRALANLPAGTQVQVPATALSQEANRQTPKTRELNAQGAERISKEGK